MFYFSLHLGHRFFFACSRVLTSPIALVSCIFPWIAFSMRLHIHQKFALQMMPSSGTVVLVLL